MKRAVLNGRDILTLEELSTDEIHSILEISIKLKQERRKGIVRTNIIKGKNVAMLFEKPSTRTRVSFDVAVAELGGHPIFMNVSETQLGRGEPVKDLARVLSGYVDCIVARVHLQEMLEQLALYSDKPVVNALSNDFHPTQLLADLMTILEVKGNLQGVTVAFVGDASWNMSNSWLYAAAKTGINLKIACPDSLRPKKRYLSKALKMAEETGARIAIYSEPASAVKNSDVIYTDVWTSMGQETDRQEMLKTLAGFTVDQNLISQAKNDAIFMHPLPAHRGEEVEDTVIESSMSVVFSQSENKLHAAKGLLFSIMTNG
jgi:ornithine carbamoyltransferase